MLGYFYPALASAKTVVQQDPTAFTQWMTYWWVGVWIFVLVMFTGVLLPGPIFATLQVTQYSNYI